MQTGESAEWSSDVSISEAWRTVHVYQTLSNPKIVHILKLLSEVCVDGKMEDVVIDSPLTVERIMPQGWVANWSLADGSKGMGLEELSRIDMSDPVTAVAVESRSRNALVRTSGNRTILTRSLSSSASNSAWTVKRKKLLTYSLLPISQMLAEREVWDEAAIRERSEVLLKLALRLWPRS